VELQSLPARSLTGRVLAANGDPAKGVEVTATLVSDLVDSPNKTRTAEDGRFEFPALFDGTWRLTVTSSPADGLRPAASLGQLITGTDVENVEIRVRDPFAVSVRVVYGAGVESRPRKSAILLVPFEGGAGAAATVLTGAGDFLVDKVIEGRYAIQMLLPDHNTYLASVRFGEREAMGEVLDIHSGGLPITLIFRGDGGIVRGTVENCGNATVVLVPQEPRLQSGQFMARGSCQQGDRFEIGDVRPGEYLAFAFEQTEDQIGASFLSDSTAMNRGARTSVRAAEATGIALKVTPRD
jgi:hypothetical protein